MLHSALGVATAHDDRGASCDARFGGLERVVGHVTHLAHGSGRLRIAPVGSQP